MAKATSIKEAIQKWENDTAQDSTTASDIQLQLQYPPIEKMDNNLSKLVQCEKLSLSTNMIERIVGIGTLSNLKVLALGRNNIKSLNGLEPLGDTLEELWISYNSIEKLGVLEHFQKLKVFYIGHNSIRDWSEINKLANIPSLADMVLLGNPLEESNDEATYKKEIAKRLKTLKKIDGEPIIRDEEDAN